MDAALEKRWGLRERGWQSGWREKLIAKGWKHGWNELKKALTFGLSS